MHTGSCFVFNLQLNSRAGMAAEELQGRQFRLHYLSGAHAELAKHHSVDPVVGSCGTLASHRAHIVEAVVAYPLCLTQPTTTVLAVRRGSIS